jgi:hypothetical protein
VAGIISSSTSVTSGEVDPDPSNNSASVLSHVNPAFLDTVERFGIPHKYFFEMIDGVTSDLEPRRVATFDELYRYCYHVESCDAPRLQIAGHAVDHLEEFEKPRRKELATAVPEPATT